MRTCITVVVAALLAQVNWAQTPGHEGLKNFQRGANLGNYLEAPKGQNWGQTYSLKDLDAIKSEGFDHIRIPARWNDYAGAGPEYKIDPTFTGKVDFLATNALSRGLAVMVNIHHFDEFTTDPAKEEAKLLALWKQIAEHYQAAPAKLGFEILNEPRDAATTEVMNKLYPKVLAVIRASNPNRVVFVAPGRWNSLNEVEKLKLPAEERNVIVTAHSYEPFLFTHQGASWTGAETEVTGLVYPGPPAKPLKVPATVKAGRVGWFKDYNTLPAAENPSGPKAFRANMEKVKAWAARENRPIHVGEFGAYTKADPESRARYYGDMRKACEEMGFGWAIWDWSAGFRYWEGDKPAAGMRQALFGKP